MTMWSTKTQEAIINSAKLRYIHVFNKNKRVTKTMLQGREQEATSTPAIFDCTLYIDMCVFNSII